MLSRFVFQIEKCRSDMAVYSNKLNRFTLEYLQTESHYKNSRYTVSGFPEVIVSLCMCILL